MSQGPLVSIIIPTYNRAAIIGETLENVFQQSYRNVEVIVVDDGSTDETQAALRKFGSRIQVHTQQNAGPAAARNSGYAMSRGDVIAFQDSDDLWHPHKLEKQVELLERFGEAVPCCLSNASFGIVNGREVTSFDMACVYPAYEAGLWTNVAEVLATRFILFNQTAAIRRKVLERTGVFDQTLAYLEDYDLPLRLAMEGPWAFLREPLVTYREGTPESFSKKAANDPITLKKCEIAIFERALDRRQPEGNPAFHRHVRGRLSVFRRLLRSLELARSSSAADRGMSRILSSYDALREKSFRRSPWYPRARTLSLADAPLPVQS